MHNIYLNLLKGKKSVDCSEILRNDPSVKGSNGVYTIYPDRINAKKVFCDMTTNGGGLTVSVFFQFGFYQLQKYFSTALENSTQYNIKIDVGPEEIFLT